MNFRPLRLILLTGLSLIVLGIGAAIALSLHGWRESDGPVASVTLNDQAPSRAIIVRVVDEEGKPLNGIEVASESDSGTDSQVTDKNGIALIRPGENEVLGLYLEGKKIWSTPYKDATLATLFSPSCGGGLRFEVVAKNH